MYVSKFLTTLDSSPARFERPCFRQDGSRWEPWKSVVGFVRLEFIGGFLLKETFTIRASMSTGWLWSCAHVQQTRKSFIICCTRKKRWCSTTLLWAAYKILWRSFSVYVGCNILLSLVVKNLSTYEDGATFSLSFYGGVCVEHLVLLNFY